VLLDGFYGRLDHYRRPRYKCVPSQGKAHRFTSDLARRQPTADHPHGPECQHCGHAVARHEGPETPRGYIYSAREIAELLVALGRGESFRSASAQLRRATGRSSRDRFGNACLAHGDTRRDVWSVNKCGCGAARDRRVLRGEAPLGGQRTQGGTKRPQQATRAH
jgi:hypothetical protein